MKTTLLLFLLFSCFSSFGKKAPEKYFLLNDGMKQNFERVDHLNGDTVFFMHKSRNNFLLVDSISALHVYNPSGHGHGAGAVGFLCGGLLGAGLGIAIAPKPGGESYAELGYGFIGFLVGGIVGAMVASSDGGKGGKDIDLDLKPYIKREKIDMLSTVLKDLN